ncbi:TPA: hypothetical protein ACSTJY_003321 [Serratia fonticola]
MDKVGVHKVIGGTLIQFDYKVTLGGKDYLGSHQITIQGKTPKELGDSGINSALQQSAPEILEKIIKQHPAEIDVAKDVQKAQFEANITKIGEFGTTFTINRK